MTPLHISFKVSFDIVGHAFCKLGNSTCADTIHVYESFMIEPVNQRECIPEEITYFEFEFIVVFLGETLTNLLYLISSSINIVFDGRFTEPTIKLTVTLLEPEKS